MFPPNEHVVQGIGPLAKAINGFIANYAFWFAKGDYDKNQHAHVHMSLDKAIIEYNLQTAVSKFLARRLIDYVLDFAPLRRTIVAILVVINFSSLVFCTYTGSFEYVWGWPYYITGLLAGILAGFALIFSGRLPRWALLTLSLVAASFVALHHISGVLNVAGTIIVDPVTKSSRHNLTKQQMTNIIIFLCGHYLTHVLLVVLFWVRGRWTETMVLGDLRVGRVRPNNMSTAQFYAHVQSLYREHFRKVCKDVFTGKAKNRSVG